MSGFLSNLLGKVGLGGGHTSGQTVEQTAAPVIQTDTQMAEESPKKTGKNVLIAMDGSKHALYAFEWYAKNLYHPDDNVIMAHCAEPGVNIPPTTLMAGNPTMIQTMMKDHEQHVMDTFKTIDQLAKKYNIKHVLERLHGPPGEAIVKAADSQNADMIVAGSRGFGTLRRTIMGSVSDYIVHHSKVPVMICKHDDEHVKLK
ncbi:universal stress protein in QAH/OAS sulfhydrylase 3'region-like isoform X1 [Mya arenaria]|uniref:universal stress protein in QAH/OAS sulfhydrylase 3'region-like isoform X1 n=1 Tax=Mya arenaria TaxID=6604 RepID=UPI0022E91CF2|nr:universal stress protein in QAH/OAS sulfhydrylase 3'region-like isoform X1 [Mya arenaria]